MNLLRCLTSRTVILLTVWQDSCMSPRNKALLISLIVMVGFVFSVVFCYVRYYYFQPHPLALVDFTFLFLPSDCFGDLKVTLDSARFGDPYSVNHTWSNYFPLAYLMFYPLSQLSRLVNIVIYVLSFSLFTIFLNATLLSTIVKKHPFYTTYKWYLFSVLTFLSYPFLFCMDRGNIEAYMFIIFGFSILFYKKERYYLAGFLLSIVTAVKLFPGVFLILLLKKKQFKAFSTAIVFGLILTFLSLLSFQGTLKENIVGLAYWLNKFNHNYADGNLGLPYSHSLFSCFKILLATFRPDAFQLNPELAFYKNGYLLFYTTLKQQYTIFWLLASLIGLWWAWFKESEFWKQLFILTAIMTLLPYSSFDYKLIYFQLPMLFFIADRKNNDLSKIYSVLFGLLLIPKSGLTLQYGIGSSVLINPLLILTILSLIIIEPWLLKRLCPSHALTI